MSLPTSLFEMEMERLDSEIEKSRKHFYSAVLGKKRRVKRTWLEISALTNAHILQMLPYKAMLGHVAKLAVERDKQIAEILAAKEGEQDFEVEYQDEDLFSNPQSETSESDTLPRSSIPSVSSSSSLSDSSNGKVGREQAVQTEESSFSKKCDFAGNDPPSA